MQKNFLMDVQFWTSWGDVPTIFKITILRWLFSKMVSNLTILECILETKFQGGFFMFRKFFRGISNLKLSRTKKSLPKNWTHLQFYKRNPRKNYSEQKKINPEIWPQKYPLGSSSWRPFLKKVTLGVWFWKLLGQLPNLSKI